MMKKKKKDSVRALDRIGGVGGLSVDPSSSRDFFFQPFILPCIEFARWQCLVSCSKGLAAAQRL